MPARGLLRCTDPFAYTDPKTGLNKVVGAGTLLASNDPVVKGRESMFETFESVAGAVVASPVEAATAAPGEQRSTTRPDKG